MKITGKQLTARMKKLGINTKRMTELTSIGENTIYRYKKNGVPDKRAYLFDLVLKEEERKSKTPQQIFIDDLEEFIGKVINEKYGHKINAIYDQIELNRINNLKKATKNILEKKESAKIA